MLKSISFATLSVSIACALPALADDAKQDCPVAVKNTIDKLFHGSKISKCKLEHEHGHDQFEVKLTKADGAAVEADVSTDGKLLQIEEKIPLEQVPAVVMKAFAARYPRAKADVAEKQTPATGKPTYELAFSTDKGRKEVTFSEDGRFIEEE